MISHQYIKRHTGRIVSEDLKADAILACLYGPLQEHAPYLFNLCIQHRMTAMLAWLQFDVPVLRRGNPGAIRRMAQQLGIDLSECLDAPEAFSSVRDLFERRIRYWDVRPIPAYRNTVVSPADARMITGSLTETDMLFAKGRFFTYPELLGHEGSPWLQDFNRGDFAVFRLTLDKYHYNHLPVSGCVIAHYELDGTYHSCNPAAIIATATPFSRNRRVVTLLDTDVPGGSQVGKVAMIEIVALMIGRITQCYSSHHYDHPRRIIPGMFLEQGQPKSLYQPGSSTDILLFEPGRIRFDRDLIDNRNRKDINSRFAIGLGESAVETDIRVRESIACRAKT
jgi:phosphatidylserine decarboxylase